MCCPALPDEGGAPAAAIQRSPAAKMSTLTKVLDALGLPIHPHAALEMPPLIQYVCYVHCFYFWLPFIVNRSTVLVT